jgi:hypothetical protein
VHGHHTIRLCALRGRGRMSHEQKKCLQNCKEDSGRAQSTVVARVYSFEALASRRETKTFTAWAFKASLLAGVFLASISSPQKAHAQFVCVGNSTGAVVPPATASGCSVYPSPLQKRHPRRHNRPNPQSRQVPQSSRRRSDRPRRRSLGHRPARTIIDRLAQTTLVQSCHRREAQFFDHRPLICGVRFGSKADMGARLDHVRFTPKSGHC